MKDNIENYKMKKTDVIHTINDLHLELSYLYDLQYHLTKISLSFFNANSSNIKKIIYDSLKEFCIFLKAEYASFEIFNGNRIIKEQIICCKDKKNIDIYEGFIEKNNFIEKIKNSEPIFYNSKGNAADSELKYFFALPIIENKKVEAGLIFLSKKENPYISEKLTNIFLTLGEIFVTSIEKITEESVLFEQYEFAFKIMNTMNQGLIVLDENGKTGYVNPAMNMMLKPLNKNIIEMYVYEYLDIDGEKFEKNNFSKRKKKLIELIKNKKICQFDGFVFGESFNVPIIGNLNYIELEGGKYSVIITITDITEKNILEGELRKNIIKAEKAVNAKNLLLGNVSHELKTPLSIILGSLDIIGMQELNDIQKQFHSEGIKAANELSGLINNLLDLSKIERNIYDSFENYFNLNELIDNLVKNYKEKAEKKGLKFTLTVPKYIPEKLKSNARYVNRILSSILENAVKFTFTGKVNLKIEEINNKSDFITYLFKVSDTGIGIDKESQESVYEKFVNPDDILTKKYNGLGIGLPIARKLTEYLNGKIYFHSNEKGTTFYVELSFYK